MRFPLLLVKLSILTVLAVTTVCAQDAEMVRQFDYDKTAPLEVKTLGTQNRGEAIVQLKLKPLPATVIDSIPELYQPPRPN